MGMHSEDSVQSLDIKTILAHNCHDAEHLLATSLSLLSIISSTVPSFTDIPSFPYHDGALPLFLNAASATTAFSRHCDHTITAPTSPRMKVMLIEPIVVDSWAETLTPSVYEDDTLDPRSQVDDPPVWVPEGSFLPPEDFQASLRSRRGSEAVGAVSAPSRSANDTCEIEHSSLQVEVSCEEPGEFIDDCTSGQEVMEREANLTVPTIMLSNSTLAVPLSFESSQSIAPLAIRRGHKVPAPLSLGILNTPEDGLYPGIPSPFLGSPSPTSPDYELDIELSSSTLDLDEMCQDLRSRCPSLRPISPLPPSMKGESSLTSSSSSESSSDDWAFARDILNHHGGGPGGLGTAPLETPSKQTQDISEKDKTRVTRSPEMDSCSWSSTPTLTNSPEPPARSSDVVKTPQETDSFKQQRRRTVIIETPRDSVIGNVHPSRVTIDLSHLAEAGNTEISPKFDEPIPFETPKPGRHRSFSESTPYTRPLSSASVRPPARGILKSREKKSVRFSIMPSMHEYPEDESEPQSSFEADPEPEHKRTSHIQGRKRASTEPGQRKQELRTRSASEKAVATKENRVTFPKHPAVRSLVRGATPSPTPLSRAFMGQRTSGHILLPRNVDKAEVGSPKKLLKRATLDSPTSSSPKPNKRKTSATDDNGNSRASMSVRSPQAEAPHKGRMSAPFRSIFTKLRASPQS